MKKYLQHLIAAQILFLKKCEDTVEFSKEYYCKDCDVVIAKLGIGNAKILRTCSECNAK